MERPPGIWRRWHAPVIVHQRAARSPPPAHTTARWQTPLPRDGETAPWIGKPACPRLPTSEQFCPLPSTGAPTPAHHTLKPCPHRATSSLAVAPHGILPPRVPRPFIAEIAESPPSPAGRGAGGEDHHPRTFPTAYRFPPPGTQAVYACVRFARETCPKCPRNSRNGPNGHPNARFSRPNAAACSPRGRNPSRHLLENTRA
jgi:hypothetical protein